MNKVLSSEIVDVEKQYEEFLGWIQKFDEMPQRLRTKRIKELMNIDNKTYKQLYKMAKKDEKIQKSENLEDMKTEHKKKQNIELSPKEARIANLYNEITKRIDLIASYMQLNIDEVETIITKLEKMKIVPSNARKLGYNEEAKKNIVEQINNNFETKINLQELDEILKLLGEKYPLELSKKYGISYESIFFILANINKEERGMILFRIAKKNNSNSSRYITELYFNKKKLEYKKQDSIENPIQDVISLIEIMLYVYTDYTSKIKLEDIITRLRSIKIKAGIDDVTKRIDEIEKNCNAIRILEYKKVNTSCSYDEICKSLKLNMNFVTEILEPEQKNI
jgi:hypothetical protein